MRTRQQQSPACSRRDALRSPVFPEPRATVREAALWQSTAWLKVAIATNTLAPYRIPIYLGLARVFELAVFTSGVETNRAMWGDLTSSLLRAGIPVRRTWGLTVRAPYRGDQRFFHFNPGYFLDLVRCKPAAVISNELGFRSLLSLIYGRLFDTPVWIWWGGTRHTEARRLRLKRRFRAFVARYVPRWISYGETSTEYLLDLGVPRHRILQVQNCVDETLFQATATAACALEPKPVLLYVGQMIGRKGLSLMLEACARLQRKGHRFSLLLVGDGPEREVLARYAHSLGLANVNFMVGQPPERMPAVYRSGDCLVFPTLSDPWGLVVNEALWSGIPVLASIYAGCAREIVPEGNRFNPVDPADFDRALLRAITGELDPPDTSVLLRCHQVADMIARDIRETLEGPKGGAA